MICQLAQHMIFVHEKAPHAGHTGHTEKVLLAGKMQPVQKWYQLTKKAMTASRANQPMVSAATSLRTLISVDLAAALMSFNA